MNLVVAGRLSQRIAAASENARRLAHGLPLDPFPRGTDEISALAQQIEDAAYLLRKREREVKDNEQRYRDLFDRAPIAFEETDREGLIRRFKPGSLQSVKMPRPTRSSAARHGSSWRPISRRTSDRR
ncbi:MAG: hypothetical protein WDO73_23080 [Ignavibacteriota bacterium]